jgi:hypothetical protein
VWKPIGGSGICSSPAAYVDNDGKLRQRIVRFIVNVPASVLKNCQTRQVLSICQQILTLDASGRRSYAQLYGRRRAARSHEAVIRGEYVGFFNGTSPTV